MNQAVMYTTAICPYCVAAKNFLAQRKIPYEERRVDIDPVLRQEMLERTKRMSVPQIFINGHHIGGYDEMLALERSGGLADILVG